ncbi:dihydroorotase family protein [Infirmifilum lucidum]|uniref:Dihydroorotase family protein n=1 Tax=Infirmifilum lucidum TaxID=2776706 RepID=A0A7L9FHQ9_9CREN|nr:dihydroorotase family protein [Infirmifilum lucidum]QOJ79191.1 dihydroorotase family protein [Infirmifilum lucidum]
MAVDLVIIGRAYLGGSFEEVAIGVDGGTIVSVTKPSLAPSSDARIEFGGKFLILPGMVDIHVHMREPGLEYKEDWGTGSRSAVKGGVTLVVDMPNNAPPANNCERLREKLLRASEKSLVDFAFYAGFNPRPEELEGCRNLFVGFKLYPEELFSQEVLNVFRYASTLGRPVVVHAEDPHFFRDAPRHSEARPPIAERSGVLRALDLAEATGAWLHVTHLSTEAALLEVLRAKTFLQPRVTFDVTPHHALLNDSLYSSALARIAVVNPPLRSEGDRRAVYASLKNRLADALVTDHAPHKLEEKLGEKPAPGFPGLEIALHVLLEEVFSGRLSLSAIELYSRKPAELLGFRKGVIAPGFDGDIVVVAREEWSIRGEEFESKAKYTPFEGHVLHTKTHAVYVRGLEVYTAGYFMADKGGRLAVPRG